VWVLFYGSSSGKRSTFYELMARRARADDAGDERTRTTGRVRSPGTRPYLPEVNFLPCEEGLFLHPLPSPPSPTGSDSRPLLGREIWPPSSPRIALFISASSPRHVSGVGSSGAGLINSTTAGEQVRAVTGRKLGALRGTCRGGFPVRSHLPATNHRFVVIESKTSGCLSFDHF